MSDMTAREAIDYLKPIAASATVGHYGEALSIAIAALEAQVPRVLTLEEAAEIDEERSVWIETRNIREPFLTLIYPRYDQNFQTIDGIWHHADYNHRYRFWTLEPTAEQMANTPWGDQC